MSRLAIHPEARIEAFDAGDYYEECCPGLGRAFTDCLETSFARIAARPQSFTLHAWTGARKCAMRRFPYLVYFIERNKTLWIVAVAHASRQPDYWYGRMNEPDDRSAR